MEDHITYKRQRAVVRKLSRQNKRESWNQFVSRIERDVTGDKCFGFRVFKSLREEENDRARINVITRNNGYNIIQNYYIRRQKRGLLHKV